jgi:hypothetical protein
MMATRNHLGGEEFPKLLLGGDLPQQGLDLISGNPGSRDWKQIAGDLNDRLFPRMQMQSIGPLHEHYLQNR